MKYYIYILLVLAALNGCSEGLSPSSSQPLDTKSFIKGTIHYLGGKDNWAYADTVVEIRVVAFKDYPPNDIITDVLTGRAYFTDAILPLYADSSSFSLEVESLPDTVKYLAAAQRYGELTEWKAIGVLYEAGTKTPQTIIINKGQSVNVRIDVDFQNLPEQPFK